MRIFSLKQSSKTKVGAFTWANSSYPVNKKKLLNKMSFLVSKYLSNISNLEFQMPFYIILATAPSFTPPTN
jgi:hypothetical protein